MKTEEQEIKEFFDFMRNAKVTYNPELDKLKEVSLFPEKVKRAKEVLAKGKLPKEYYEQMAKKNEDKEK